MPDDKTMQELLTLRGIILSKIKDINPADAFQAAMGVYNFYNPETPVTSSVSINLTTGEETPIFPSRSSVGSSDE